MRRTAILILMIGVMVMLLSTQKAVAESPSVLFECKSSDVIQDQETGEFALLLTIGSYPSSENTPDFVIGVPESHPFYADYAALEIGDKFLLESDSSIQEEDRVQCGIVVIEVDGCPYVAPLYTDTYPKEITL